MESTHPEIEQFIINGLNRGTEGDTRWKEEQEQIGWMNFLTGFLSNNMVEMQQCYYRTNGTRKAGHRWAGKIILQCWNIIHNMWLGRNEVLHNKTVINELQGEVLLDLE
jgi:hypothetical protein